MRGRGVNAYPSPQRDTLSSEGAKDAKMLSPVLRRCLLFLQCEDQFTDVKVASAEREFGQWDNEKSGARVRPPWGRDLTITRLFPLPRKRFEPAIFCCQRAFLKIAKTLLSQVSVKCAMILTSVENAGPANEF